MKKNIFVIAIAAFAICMSACQKEDPIVITPANNGNNGNIPTESNVRVKSTSDLHNTDWTYTVTYFEFLNNLGIDTTCMSGIEDDTMSFGLNFDGTYAHFSFPENIMAFGGEEGMLEQITGVSYVYSYDATVSQLGNSTGGSHEITVGILLPVPEQKHKVKAIRCPSF